MQERERFGTVRSGDEPRHARSALRARLALAGFGLTCGIVGIVVFAVIWALPLIVLFAVLAAVAGVNMAVVAWRIRQGSAFQPGREVPPYRPVRPKHHSHSHG